MKNSVLTMILVMMMTVWAIAQERPVLTLDSCHSMAVEHNPLTKQRNLYEEAFRLQSKSIGSNYLPQTTLYALASWQSEDTGFPVSLPGIEIPAVSNDNYKIYLDVNQLIWDGGSVRRQKELEASSMQIDLAGVDAENYRLKESINQLYFSILQFQANEKLLILAMDELYTRLAVLRAGISNGTILPSNADVLDAEIAVIGQALTDLRYNKSAGLYKLGELTGLNTGPETRLILPEYENLPLSLTDTKARPEYRIFGMQQEKISRQISLTGIRVMPRLSAFTTLGYGRPGLNMLSNDFESYAMLGARFSWKLWDWNQHRNDQSVLSVQQQIIDTRKEAFEM
jgi:outer membrane protein TolC